MIRVELPYHLRSLANLSREVTIQVDDSPTLGDVLEAIETQYPMLRGTFRDAMTKQRRPFIRFFACGQDLSHDPLESSLPEAVVAGSEPLRIVGAMAGG